MTRNQRGEAEPAAADLAAIEAEWPVIDAELARLDAEITALSGVGGGSPLDWRRLRRAERRVLAARVRRLEASRASWVLACRDTERDAWRALYDALYPSGGSADAAGVA